MSRIKTTGAMLLAGLVCMAGGVACNTALRDRLKETALQQGVAVFFPRPAYCTDNGAMIALAGYHRILHGERADLSIDVRSRYPVEDLAPLIKPDSKGSN